MPEFVWTLEFWVGAVALCVFQIGKFNELNSADPRFARLSHAPNLRASDFAGRRVFVGALLVFLVLTLVLYVVLCLFAPRILGGWTQVTAPGQAAEEVAKTLGLVPIPLLVAAAFMGLAQPSVPGLSKIANIQRDAFHYLLGVPRTAMLMVDAASTHIFAHDETKKQLADRIERLVSTAWLARLQQFADVGFYRQEIERLKLDIESDIDEMRRGSIRELRNALAQLVYAASIATIRQSGVGRLDELAKALSIPVAKPESGGQHTLRTVFLGSFASLIFLIFAVPMAQPAVAGIYSHATFWPTGLGWSLNYAVAQVTPIFISVLLLAALIPSSELRQLRPEQLTAIGLLNRHISFILLVVCAVVAFDYAQALYDYSLNVGYLKGLVAFMWGWLPYHILHAFISVTVCMVIIWHLSSTGKKRDRVAVRKTLISIIGLVGIVAMFYATARSIFQYKAGLALDFIALIAVLNVTAAVIAFFAVLSLKRRSVDMPMAAAE